MGFQEMAFRNVGSKHLSSPPCLSMFGVGTCLEVSHVGGILVHTQLSPFLVYLIGSKSH